MVITDMIKMNDLELAAKQVADSVEFYKKITNKKVHDAESLWQKFIKEQDEKVAIFWEKETRNINEHKGTNDLGTTLEK